MDAYADKETNIEKYCNIPTSLVRVQKELSEDNVVCWQSPNFNSNCQLVCLISKVKLFCLLTTATKAQTTGL